MKRSTILAAGLAAVIATPAVAQAPAFVSQEGPDLWRASRLVGVEVLGPDGRKVGDVSDVLVDHEGRAVDVVIGVGGFLGIGQKDVALPYAQVHFTQDPRPGAAGAGAPDSAAGMPTEPGMAAGSAVPVETSAAQSVPAAASATGGPPRSAALGGPVGTTAGVPGGTVTGQASAPTPEAAAAGGATAAPARGTARPDHATVDLTAEQLKAAPSFGFAR